MKCPTCLTDNCRCAKCGAVLKNPVSIAGGRKGGLAKVKSKGFGYKRNKVVVTGESNEERT